MPVGGDEAPREPAQSPGAHSALPLGEDLDTDEDLDDEDLDTHFPEDGDSNGDSNFGLTRFRWDTGLPPRWSWALLGWEILELRVF